MIRPDFSSAAISVILLLLVGGCEERPARSEVGSSEVEQAALNQPAPRAPEGTVTHTPDDLIRLEEAYANALINKDRAFLEAYYAPDFRGGNWMGFWTKSTMLKAVLDDRYSIKSMDLSNVKVRIIGSNAIVQGVSTEVTRVDGKDTSGRWTFTDVFEFRDGRWLAVAGHTSEVQPN